MEGGKEAQWTRRNAGPGLCQQMAQQSSLGLRSKLVIPDAGCLPMMNQTPPGTVSRQFRFPGTT